MQIGITLVGILSGAFGGATIAEKLAPQLKRFPAIELYADNISFGLVVLVIIIGPISETEPREALE